MGNRYANVTLNGSSQEGIAKALRDDNRSAIVSATAKGITIVYDEESESQDGVIVSLAKQLSDKHRCVTWAVFNYDDDVLFYWLFDNGELIDEYNSSPGYFEGQQTAPSGGDAKKLCQAFGATAAEVKVHDILHYSKTIGGESLNARYLFETERHLHLCRAIGLPDHAVGTGYGYLIEGETPEGFNLDDCVILEGDKD